MTISLHQFFINNKMAERSDSRFLPVQLAQIIHNQEGPLNCFPRLIPFYIYFLLPHYHQYQHWSTTFNVVRNSSLRCRKCTTKTPLDALGAILFVLIKIFVPDVKRSLVPSVLVPLDQRSKTSDPGKVDFTQSSNASMEIVEIRL